MYNATSPSFEQNEQTVPHLIETHTEKTIEIGNAFDPSSDLIRLGDGDEKVDAHIEVTEDVKVLWCEQLLSDSALNKVLEEQLGSSRLGPLWGTILVGLVYCVIMLVGALGNVGSAVVSVCRRELHSAPYLYVMSLSVAGVLMLSGIPFEVLATFSLYPFPMPEYVCILHHFACECGSYASALTVTAFTVERFLAVRSPVRMFLAAKRMRTVRICAVVWLASVIAAAVFSAQFGLLYISVRTASASCTIRRSSHCTLTFSRELKHSLEMSSILFFVIPYFVIAVLHVLIIARLRSTRSLWEGSSGAPTQFLKVTFPPANTPQNGASPVTNRRAQSSRHRILTPLTPNAIRRSFEIERKSKSVAGTPTKSHAHLEIQISTAEQNVHLTVPSRIGPEKEGMKQSHIRPRCMSSGNYSGRAATPSRTSLHVQSSVPSSTSQSSNELKTFTSPPFISIISNGPECSNRMMSLESNSGHNRNNNNSLSVVNRRVKAANRLLVSVCLAFLICWAPFHTQRILARYWIEPSSPRIPSDALKVNLTDGIEVPPTNREVIESLDVSRGWQLFVYYIVGILYYSIVAINPILYNVMSRDFRHAFLRLCRCPSHRNVSGYDPEHFDSPAGDRCKMFSRGLTPLLRSQDSSPHSELQNLEMHDLVRG